MLVPAGMADQQGEQARVGGSDGWRDLPRMGSDASVRVSDIHLSWPELLLLQPSLAQ